MTANARTDHHDTVTIKKRKHEIELDQIVVDRIKMTTYYHVNVVAGGELVIAMYV